MGPILKGKGNYDKKLIITYHRRLWPAAAAITLDQYFLARFSLKPRSNVAPEAETIRTDIGAAALLGVISRAVSIQTFFSC